MTGPKIRAEVRSRAQNTCEYCHLHQDDSPLALLHVEHIIPKMQGGSDDLDNLALACIDCNLHKGPNLRGWIRKRTRLLPYRSAKRSLDDHFEWQGIELVGKTTTGRTTIRVLNMNSEDQLSLRSS